MHFKISCAALALLLSACCNEQSINSLRTPKEIPVAAEKDSGIAAAVVAATTGVKFHVQLENLSGIEVHAAIIDNSCVAALSDNAVMNVSWNTQNEILIYVVNAQGNKKLWVHASGVGEEKTGAWVSEETKFIIEDKSGKHLGGIQIKKDAC